MRNDSYHQRQGAIPSECPIRSLGLHSSLGLLSCPSCSLLCGKRKRAHPEHEHHHRHDESRQIEQHHGIEHVDGGLSAALSQPYRLPATVTHRVLHRRVPQLSLRGQRVHAPSRHREDHGRRREHRALHLAFFPPPSPLRLRHALPQHQRRVRTHLLHAPRLHVPSLRSGPATHHALSGRVPDASCLRGTVLPSPLPARHLLRQRSHSVSRSRGVPAGRRRQGSLLRVPGAPLPRLQRAAAQSATLRAHALLLPPRRRDRLHRPHPARRARLHDRSPAHQGSGLPQRHVHAGGPSGGHGLRHVHRLRLLPHGARRQLRGEGGGLRGLHHRDPTRVRRQRVARGLRAGGRGDGRGGGTTGLLLHAVRPHGGLATAVSLQRILRPPSDVAERAALVRRLLHSRCPPDQQRRAHDAVRDALRRAVPARLRHLLQRTTSHPTRRSLVLPRQRRRSRDLDGRRLHRHVVVRADEHHPRSNISLRLLPEEVHGVRDALPAVVGRVPGGAVPVRHHRRHEPICGALSACERLEDGREHHARGHVQHAAVPPDRPAPHAPRLAEVERGLCARGREPHHRCAPPARSGACSLRPGVAGERSGVGGPHARRGGGVIVEHQRRGALRPRLAHLRHAAEVHLTHFPLQERPPRGDQLPARRLRRRAVVPRAVVRAGGQERGGQELEDYHPKRRVLLVEGKHLQGDVHHEPLCVQHLPTERREQRGVAVRRALAVLLRTERGGQPRHAVDVPRPPCGAVPLPRAHLPPRARLLLRRHHQPLTPQHARGCAHGHRRVRRVLAGVLPHARGVREARERLYVHGPVAPVRRQLSAL